MFERIRFARYALRFERAFKTDDWAAVKECFHPDARYVIIGTATRYDGETRGPEAIASVFKQMLDALDRKFDRRQPALRGWPRVRAGELILPWKVRYTLGERAAVLNGESRCRFSGGKIIELVDTMDAAEVARWLELSNA